MDQTEKGKTLLKCNQNYTETPKTNQAEARISPQSLEFVEVVLQSFQSLFIHPRMEIESKEKLISCWSKSEVGL